MAQLPWYGITVAGNSTIPQLAMSIGQTNAIDLVFSEFRANWNLLNSDAIIEGYSTVTTQYAELEELLLGDNNSALALIPAVRLRAGTLMPPMQHAQS